MCLVDALQGGDPGVDPHGDCFVNACDCDAVSRFGRIHHLIEAKHCNSMWRLSFWNSIGVLLHQDVECGQAVVQPTMTQVCLGSEYIVL